MRRTPATPAAVILLHGGRSEALQSPPLINLPALRMRPFAAAVAREPAIRDLLVAEVRNRHRGWNGTRCDAAQDAEALSKQLSVPAGHFPVVLVGHSMGGRFVLRAARDPTEVWTAGLGIDSFPGP